MQQDDGTVLNSSSIQAGQCQHAGLIGQQTTHRRVTYGCVVADDEPLEVDVQSVQVDTSACTDVGRTSITTRSAHRAIQHAKFDMQDAVQHLTTSDYLESIGPSTAASAAKAAAQAAAAAMIVPLAGTLDSSCILQSM